jgi:hypothetical protein
MESEMQLRAKLVFFLFRLNLTGESLDRDVLQIIHEHLADAEMADSAGQTLSVSESQSNPLVHRERREHSGIDDLGDK